MTANERVSFALLHDRFTADREAERAGGSGIVDGRLAGALDAIGWRSVGGESSEEVAVLARYIVASCVTGHRDPRRAAWELADLLRSSTAGLDGSLPSTSAFVPAAEQLLQHYAGTTTIDQERK